MTIKVTFGQWVQLRRTEQNFTIQKLASLATVDVGTISRIENERTQATITTAFSIFSGLSSTPLEFFASNEENSIWEDQFVKNGNSSKKASLTGDDVKAFVALHEKTPQEARELIIYLLTEGIKKLSDMGLEKGPTLSMSDLKRVSTLLDLPPRMFHIEVEYCSDLSNEILRAICNQGGVLIHEDIELFLRRANYLLQQKEQNSQDNNFSNLLHRVQNSPLEKVKFADLVLLDQELGQNGGVIPLYWEIQNFKREIHSYIMQLKSVKSQNIAGTQSIDLHKISQIERLAFTLIKITRWFQVGYWEDTAWLDKIRNKLIDTSG